LAELGNDVSAEVVDVVPEEEIRLCLFSIGEELYALPIEVLTEIIIAQKIFPVPTTPPHVLGTINLRGNIVPIIDIRFALSLPPQSKPEQIIIIRHHAILLGIIVDNVIEVASVPESSFLPLPSENTGPTRYFKSVVQREGEAAGLLDIERLFSAVKLA
jgi:purine-binding chemotaxis protein CheW